MLAVQFFSKRIRTQIPFPYQWLNITFNGIRSSSSSTSNSSSSDSDSDCSDGNNNQKELKIDYLKHAKEARKKRQIVEQLAKTAKLINSSTEEDKHTILTRLLNNISNINLQYDNSIRKSTKDQEKVSGEVNIKYKENSAEKGQLIEKVPKKQRGMLKITNDNVKTKKKSPSTQFGMKKLKKQKEMLRVTNDNVEMKIKPPREPSIIQKLMEQQKMLRVTNDNVETKIKPPLEPSIIQKLMEQQKMLRVTNDNVETKIKPPREPSIIQKLMEQQKMLRVTNDNVETKIKPPREPSIIQKLMEQQKMLRVTNDNVETKIKPPLEPSIIQKLMEQQKMLRFTKDNVETKIKPPRERKNKIGNKFIMKRMSQFGDINDDFERKYKTQPWKTEDSSVPISRKRRKMKFTNLRHPDTSKFFEKIFVMEPLETPIIPKFKLWDTYEEQELQSLLVRYPDNALQEMIEWTKQGKLWKFPIDNEQGMEKEQSVHFSKHVFLESHLAPWCPSKGPLRHFMELVCVGLSKNPYMTIEEKYDHIMWYKDFFADKQDLLDKLGLVE